MATLEGRFISAAVDPANATAVASVDTDLTGQPVKTSDVIIPIPPVDLEAGLACQGATVPTDGTIRVRITNASAGAINGASKQWGFLVISEAI